MEILIPENHNGSRPLHDPYPERGARSVLRRFRDDLLLMLLEMERNAENFSQSGGKTFLAQSPLRRKPYVAAAMKTMGWVEERPSPNGACALVLTKRGRQQIANARAMGWMEAAE